MENKLLPLLELTQLFSELITDDATSEELISWKIFLGQSKSIPEHVALSKWIIVNKKFQRRISPY